jgi:hypothetical protein
MLSCVVLRLFNAALSEQQLYKKLGDIVFDTGRICVETFLQPSNPVLEAPQSSERSYAQLSGYRRRLQAKELIREVGGKLILAVV